MALVNRVGRKRFRARIALVWVYLILILGAATTVYPFLVMISGGFRGATDANDTSFVPRYWSEFATPAKPGTKLPAPESLLGKYLADKYAGDQSSLESTRRGSDASEEEVDRYESFLSKLPPTRWLAGFRLAPTQVTSRLNVRYQEWLRKRYGTIDVLNRAYIEENTVFQTVQPPAEMLERPNWKPPETTKFREWLEFKKTLPVEFRIPIRRERYWQEFLRSKFKNAFKDVPKAVAGRATKFEEIRLDDTSNANSSLKEEFWSAGYPLGAEHAYRVSHGNFKELPIDSMERRHATANREAIRQEFTWRNFRYVLDYVAIHGRALWNTVIFCGLAILTQLTVNPLAAYALSRFPMKATGQILLFLLATMAFPAEVAMIPSFLLLKDLGLLNTFAALVLPTAASGYMIYLLKGFFDSLPTELFESGQIDGASETRMLWKIALPLSKPVLGYMALMAFMAAYSAFMYAFLVAQDQRIWTLMVFIYQLQNSAPKPVMMAALTLAAIPTLIVFLLAQGVIMRGIVLPGEK